MPTFLKLTAFIRAITRNKGSKQLGTDHTQQSIKPSGKRTRRPNKLFIIKERHEAKT